jgi:hypothetical protein
MTTIRRFVFATLLAFTALNFAPSLASGQDAARGKFTLTHEVHWGSAKIPAGDYQFSFDPNETARTLTLTKISGVRAGYMLLVPVIDETKPSDVSRIVLETTLEGSYVSALQLPASGMILQFAVPHIAERQIAKAATTGGASGQ